MFRNTAIKLLILALASPLFGITVRPVFAEDAPVSTLTGQQCLDLEKKFLEMQFAYGQTLSENAAMKAQKFQTAPAAVKKEEPPAPAETTTMVTPPPTP